MLQMCVQQNLLLYAVAVTLWVDRLEGRNLSSPPLGFCMEYVGEQLSLKIKISCKLAAKCLSQVGKSTHKILIFFFFNYMKCWFSYHQLQPYKKNDTSAFFFFFCGVCVFGVFFLYSFVTLNGTSVFVYCLLLFSLNSFEFSFFGFPLLMY